MAGMMLPGQQYSPRRTRRDGESYTDPITGAESVWSTAAGQYVSRDTLGQLSSGQATADPTNNRIINMGPVGSGLSGGGGISGTGYTPQSTARPRTAPVSSGGSSNGDAQRNAALSALSDQVKASMGQQAGMTAPKLPTATADYTGDAEADQAQYGAAKERIGLALQSALKGLRETMAGRGLAGSGIEGEATGDLFTSGLGELADTDRAMATANADRAFDSNQADTDRVIQQRQFGAQQQMQAQQAQRGDQSRAFELLLQIAQGYS